MGIIYHIIPIKAIVQLVCVRTYLCMCMSDTFSKNNSFELKYNTSKGPVQVQYRRN